MNQRVRQKSLVVALGEVAVVAVEDGVGLARLDIGAFPLANARATRVGKNRCANTLEVLHVWL